MNQYRRHKKTQFNPIAVFLVALSLVLLVVSALSIFSSASLARQNDELNSRLNDTISKVDSATSQFEALQKENEPLKDTIKDQSSQIVSLQQMKASKTQGSSGSGYTGPKVCYLTFDDGPSENTKPILDVLEKKGVKATFFVKHNGNPELLKTIADAGHTVAIHTYSHDYGKIYKSTDAFFEDLYKIQNEIEQYTGVKTKICRFPGGSSNTISRSYCKGVVTSIAARMKQEGFIYFDWNVDSTDASGNNIPADKLLKSIKNNIGSQKCINVLMHDTGAKDTTVEALPDIIDYIRSKGYSFEAITEKSYAHHHGINN